MRYPSPAITNRTKAIIPVDVFGITSDMDAICALAKSSGLRVVEDSCEALGATYRNQPAGSLGDAGVFGFYPNKQITTGEGGMVVTDDDSIADLARIHDSRDTSCSTSGLRVLCAGGGARCIRSYSRFHFSIGPSAALAQRWQSPS